MRFAVAGAALAACASAGAPPGSEFRDCADCPLMTVVPAGAFDRADDPNPWIRGDAARGPTRLVVLARPYAIGVFEVTFAEWDACAAANACRAIENDEGFGRGARPVIHVAWDDAAAYAAWLSGVAGAPYRLPTEAEWEWAARGGRDAEFLHDGGPEGLCAYANIADATAGLDWATDACSDSSGAATLPVGSASPNGYGLYDVAGNVWEWVADCWHDPEWEARGSWSSAYPAAAPTDGTAFIGAEEQCASRVMRGGSWNNGAAHAFSPQFRNFDHRRRDYPNLGFRVVRDLD